LFKKFFLCRPGSPKYFYFEKTADFCYSFHHENRTTGL
jgi:hypothetical protein